MRMRAGVGTILLSHSPTKQRGIPDTCKASARVRDIVSRGGLQSACESVYVRHRGGVGPWPDFQGGPWRRLCSRVERFLKMFFEVIVVVVVGFDEFG